MDSSRSPVLGIIHNIEQSAYSKVLWKRDRPSICQNFQKATDGVPEHLNLPRLLDV